MTLDEQLRRDEGVRLKPYVDSVGKVTVGVGRNLSDVGLSVAEASLLLSNDIQAARVALAAHFLWTETLDEARRGVLLNMTFNLGIGGLSQFRDFLSKMQAGEWDEASAAMLDSKWAEQVGPRAHRLSLQIQTGEWQ